MEDTGKVGITRKESIRALSNLLHETQVLNILEGDNLLTIDVI